MCFTSRLCVVCERIKNVIKFSYFLWVQHVTLHMLYDMWKVTKTRRTENFLFAFSHKFCSAKSKSLEMEKNKNMTLKHSNEAWSCFFVDWIIISDNFAIIAVKSTKNNSRNAIGIYFAFLTCHFHFTFLFFLSFSIKKHFLEIQSNEICIWNFQFFFCFFSHFFPIAVSILFHVIKHPKYNTVGVA